MVLAAKRDRSDGTFDRVVVEFDSSVMQEQSQGAPTRQCIPDCIAEASARWDAFEGTVTLASFTCQ